MVNLAIPGTLGNFLQNEKNLNEKKKGVLFGEYKSVIKTFFFLRTTKLRKMVTSYGHGEDRDLDQEGGTKLEWTSSIVPDFPWRVHRCQVLRNGEEKQQEPGGGSSRLQRKKKKKPAPPIVSLRKEMFMNVKLNS